MVDNLKYGTQPFELTVTNASFYKIFFLTILAAAGFWVASYLVGWLLGSTAPGLISLPLTLPIINITSTIALYFFLYAVFSAQVTNLVFNNSHGGDTRFYSTLPVMGYAWVVLTNTIATALTLGFFHPWASVRAWRYRMAHLSLATPSLEGFVAERQEQVEALGSEATDLLGFDFGL